MVSGLASSIRSATDSASFDLAGSDASSIRAVVQDAFSSPLPLAAMIRITFVVGGGKQSRQKYDDRAMQAVTSALRQLGYVEDRGASCVLECGGSFKSQHDTGKNAYTVVVFPRVAGDGDDDEGDGGEAGEDDEPLIPTNSPGYKMAVCSRTTFQNLLATYCPTYLEKRECLNCLEGLLQLEQAIEDKLMHGHPLDSAEQSFYDDSTDLKEKYSYAQKETTKHVEDGRLTLEEKAILVEMNERKIEKLMKEKSSAATAEKLKKALARKQQLQSLRDDALEDGSGSYPPPLRHESQITALRKKLLPLRTLEGSSRGRLLTLAETRSLAKKGEIEGEIDRLEYASCGWFEEEDRFRERLRRSRDDFESRHARSKRGGGGGRAAKSGYKAGGGGAAAINKWILPGEKPKSAWGASSAKKKLKGKGGAVFSAMMMDSSSEEEEEGSDEESAEDDAGEESPFTVISPKRKPHPAAAASNVFASKKAAALMEKRNAPATAGDGKGDGVRKQSKSSSGIEKESTDGSKPAETAATTAQTKRNKKKKKSKKKSKQSTEQRETEVSSPASSEKVAESKNEAPSATEDAPSSVSASLLEFWRSLLFPFIMFVLNVLTSLVMYLFGCAKKKGGKKKRG